MKHNNERLARLSRRLDPVWWLVARLWGLGRRTYPTVPTSILLIELHLLGDMVMLIPLLRTIRRTHPDAWIGLLAGPWGREILGDTGLVDEYITLRAPWVSKGQRSGGLRRVLRAVRQSRIRRWDWGIDVRGDVRNVLLLVLARASRRVAYNFSGGAALLTDVVPDDGVLRHIIDHHAALADHLAMPMLADEMLPRLGQAIAPTTSGGTPDARQLIAFHFGASMVLRRMPLSEACALINFCFDQGDHRLVLIDAPDLQSFNTEILQRLPRPCADAIERWHGSLPDLIGFLSTVDRFYAMDSGPAHLAAALGVDTTVFFGPHLSMAVCPRGRAVTPIERRDVLCRPCDQHRCVNVRYQECLTDLVPLLATPT